MITMKTYLVGGAVRDKLLGLNAKDNDWVIVGTTPTELKKLGYKQILASFPVFLHLKTGEEYALARTERKVAKGYHGFEVCFVSTTTLKEDLARRDLTINSIAIDSAGKIIDPYNGQADIKKRILRHTSTRFKEDPLRIIRLARFMAQLHDFKFSIAESTRLLVKEILASGELSHLTKERLNIEFKKAMNYPNIFFNTLNSLGCLETVFPNISKSINKIPSQSFFENSNYKSATLEEKIALALYNCASNEIDYIKIELNLSNNHYKLTIAISAIHNLTTDIHTAEEILHTFKRTNILRDDKLFDKSFNLYQKLASILDQDMLKIRLANLKSMIVDIQAINIKLQIKNTPKHLISISINQLYLDTINKHIKI